MIPATGSVARLSEARRRSQQPSGLDQEDGAASEDEEYDTSAHAESGSELNVAAKVLVPPGRLASPRGLAVGPRQTANGQAVKRAGELQVSSWGASKEAPSESGSKESSRFASNHSQGGAAGETSEGSPKLKASEAEKKEKPREPQQKGTPTEQLVKEIFAEQLDGVRRSLLEGQRRVLAEFGHLHAEKRCLQRRISSVANVQPIIEVTEPDQTQTIILRSLSQPEANETDKLQPIPLVRINPIAEEMEKTVETGLKPVERSGMDVSASSLTPSPVFHIRNVSEDTATWAASETGDEATHSCEADFTVLQIWRKKSNSRKLLRSAQLRRASEDSCSSSNLRSRLNEGIRRTSTRCAEFEGPPEDFGTDEYHQADGRCMIHPANRRRIIWDIVSLTLTVYDLVMLPLLLFNLPQVGFIDAMGWITRFFWTLDIFMSFNTGFIRRDGVVELRSRQVWRQYLRQWFLMDVLLVTFDWVEFFMQSAGLWGMARGAKSVTRPIRIIRMVRLLRLLRMQEAMSLVVERISSEKLLISVNIAKLLSGMIFVAHFVACLWYVIGDSSDNPKTWVQVYGYDRSDTLSVYLMSMRWSLSQFTGGMEDVGPVNNSERLFAICSFVVGFIIAVLLVSSLTSQMTQLSIIGSHNSKQLAVLRRFLSQSGISSRLALRLQRNAQHSMQENQRVMPEESVALLQLISKPLLEELHMEVYAPIYSAHPFFRIYAQEQPQVMRKVCHSASSTTLFCKGDIIFTTGELPSQPKVYFPRSGKLVYKPMSGFGDKEVGQGDWISEPVLWTHWMHRGMLVATDDSRLCMLDAMKFQEIVTQFEHLIVDPMEYAQEFVTSMNLALDEVNDLPGEWFLGTNELASALPRKGLLRSLSLTGHIAAGVASTVNTVGRNLPSFAMTRSTDMEMFAAGRLVPGRQNS